MVSLLLDTNVISELRRGDRCDAHVRSWAASVDQSELYTSVVVLGELKLGVERARRRAPDFATELESWLGRIVTRMGDRILPIDRAIALAWGRLAASRTVPPIDGLLAATAFVHGLVVVTRNLKDFADLGVGCFNPFEPQQ